MIKRKILTCICGCRCFGRTWEEASKYMKQHRKECKYDRH
jgi:hypothetical protein